jgi:hypothetical protein
MFRIPRAAIVLAALTLPAVAGCKSDDDISTAACDAYADFQAAFFGDPAAMATAAQAFADAAPDEIADEATAIVTAVNASADDPAAMEAPEVSTALETVGSEVFDGCDAEEQLEVSGVDYAFEDLPKEIDAGRLALQFTNDSESDEPHELVIATGADGQSAGELAGLPIEQLFEQARPVAVAFTNAPDQTATTLVDLEPGEYLVICTLPVGGFSENQDGPPADPHSAHGMVATLTVV